MTSPVYFYDFHYFWTAGRVALQGQNPYDLSLFSKVLYSTGWPINEGFHGTPYPPFVIAFYSLFAALPFESSAAIWMTLQCLAAMAGVRLCLEALPQHQKLSFGKALFVALLFPPFYSTLINGQVNFLMLLGVLYLTEGLEKKRAISATLGLLLTLIKPHLFGGLYLAAGLVAMRERNTRFIVLAPLAVLLAAGISELAFPGIWASYLQSTADNLPSHAALPGTALSQVIQYYLDFQPACLIFAAFFWLAALGLAIRVKRRGKNFWSLVNLLSICGTPYLWSHTLIVVLPSYLRWAAGLIHSSERKSLYLFAAIGLLGLPDLLRPVRLSWTLAIVPLLLLWYENRAGAEKSSS